MNLLSVSECRKATLLPKATVAHRDGGISIGDTVRKDLTGKRFGRLVATKWLRISPTSKMSIWLCCCDCGNEKEIQIGNLTSGHTRSCGCLNSEMTIARNTIHGCGGRRTKTKEFGVWLAMRQRCADPNAINYERYGARGIVVCDRWKTNFLAFLEDMGKCPDGYTLERINNAGNYEPSNCKWATDFEQRTNRRDNRYVTFNGITLAAVAWDIKCGFPKGTVRTRLFHKWPIEKIINQPVRGRK